MNTSSNPHTGALSGLKVLDLSRFIAGPYCAMLLGDMGADVVKVETPGKGENSRSFHPQFGGESIYSMVVNRNKRGMTLNFRSEQGQAVLRDLISKADVVIENFVPGTLEKMGCGWKEMHQLNPRLVMTRISGFKSTGPYANKPCFDVVAQAMSGLMDLTGQPDGPPTAAGVFLVDYATAMYATIGTLGAIQHQSRTGEGQLVEATLMSSALSMLMTAIPEQILFNRTPTRMGTRDRFNAPGNTFKAADGSWILLITVGDDKFRALAQCMNREDLLANPQFSTNDARMRNVSEIEAIVQEWTGQHSVDELVLKLEEIGIPCAKVNTIANVVTDRNVIESELLMQQPQRGGDVPLQGFPFGMNATPPVLRHSAPSIGEHTDEVLREWLDFSPEAIAAYRASNAI
ncbi:CaiB/BaiF CoA transferase family protein [Cupriavidus pinatubonensis]|uniref:Succinyl-CoA--L-malate CoA-transferase beta subunit n=1 Tax=Cupriavidus pinatubonensis TaxID=248026 RepID=A0ABM8XST7_9BURK|nr:CoA transferase [Cupriavidus pinatubonensis]CAG9183399.1 Succinyl-CoA--L-malate CoA-transferase beta subunit [Cupriavidus pinatubonensis]